MRLEVFVEQKREEVDEPIYLQLVKDGFVNTVRLIVVDKNGDHLSNGAILSIDKSGVIRHAGLSRALGFARQSNGQIIDRS